MLYYRIIFFGVRAITHRRPKRRNKSGPQLSILAPGYARFQLQTTVDMLNSSTARVPHWLNDSNWEWRDTDITEAQQELRRLIAEWLRSGPNLLKLFKENPELQASCTEGTTMLIPNRDGVAQLAWFPRAVGHKNASQKDAALSRFIHFLVNPLAPTLGGPCERCGRFYIKNTKRQKTYCSHQCGTANTALTATQKRRQMEYSRKLMIAQRAIEQWSKRGSSRTSWKKWVSSRSENDITQQWLTRAVNSGKLATPLTGRHGQSWTPHKSPSSPDRVSGRIHVQAPGRQIVGQNESFE